MLRPALLFPAPLTPESPMRTAAAVMVLAVLASVSVPRTLPPPTRSWPVVAVCVKVLRPERSSEAMGSAPGVPPALLRPMPTAKWPATVLATRLPLPVTFSAVFAPPLASLKTLPTPTVTGPLTVSALPPPMKMLLAVAELVCTVRLVALSPPASRSSVLILALADAAVGAIPNASAATELSTA